VREYAIADRETFDLADPKAPGAGGSCRRHDGFCSTKLRRDANGVTDALDSGRLKAA
jgi:hypothetical protein